MDQDPNNNDWESQRQYQDQVPEQQKQQEKMQEQKQNNAGQQYEEFLNQMQNRQYALPLQGFQMQPVVRSLARPGVMQIDLAKIINTYNYQSLVLLLAQFPQDQSQVVSIFQLQIKVLYQALVRILKNILYRLVAQEKQITQNERFQAFRQMVNQFNQVLIANIARQDRPIINLFSQFVNSQYFRPYVIKIAFQPLYYSFTQLIVQFQKIVRQKAMTELSLENILEQFYQIVNLQSVQIFQRYFYAIRYAYEQFGEAFIFEGVVRYMDRPLSDGLLQNGNTSLLQLVQVSTYLFSYFQYKQTTRLATLFDLQYQHLENLLKYIVPPVPARVPEGYPQLLSQIKNSKMDFFSLIYIKFAKNQNRSIKAYSNQIMWKYLFGRRGTPRYTQQPDFQRLMFSNDQQITDDQAFPLQTILVYQLYQVLFRHKQVMEFFRYWTQMEFDYQRLPGGQIYFVQTKSRQIEISCQIIFRIYYQQDRNLNDRILSFTIELEPVMALKQGWQNINRRLTLKIRDVIPKIMNKIMQKISNLQDNYQMMYAHHYRILSVRIFNTNFPNMDVFANSFPQTRQLKMLRLKVLDVLEIPRIRRPWTFFSPEFSKYDAPIYASFLRRDLSKQRLQCWKYVLKFLLQRKNITQNTFGKISALFGVKKQFDKGLKVLSKQTKMDIFWMQKRQWQISQFQSSLIFVIIGKHLTIGNRINLFSQKQKGNFTLSMATKVKQFQQFGQDNIVQIFNCSDPNQSIIRRRSIFFDIESYGAQQRYHTPYMVCYCGSWQQQPVEQSIISYTANPLQLFALKILRKSQQITYTVENPLYIYAFNGLKYDFVFLMKYLVLYFGKVKSFGHITQSKGYTMKQGTIVLRDTRTILPFGKLGQLCKQYQSQYQKMQKEQIDIAQYTQLTQVIQNQSLIQKYCKLDCLALMSLTTKMYIQLLKIIGRITRQQLKIKQREDDQNDKRCFPLDYTRGTNKVGISLKELHKCSTSASVALLLFKRVFLQKNIKDTQPVQWKAIQRKYYYGGICQVIRLWNFKKQKICAFDINSSYPFSMTKQQPWFFVRQLQKQQILKVNQNPSLIQDLTFYVLQSFNFKQNSFPFIGIKTKQGLLYLKNSKKQIGVWGHTLKMCFQYSVIKAAKYQSRGVKDLQNYVRRIYPLKNSAKTKNQKNLYKLFLNSLYGKFGQKSLAQFQLCPPTQSILPQFQIGNQNNFNSFKQYQSKQHLVGIGQFVRIASYISSHSRLVLAKAANVVGIDNLFYCDTDSLYVNQTGQTILKQKGYIHQEQLGKWKQQGRYSRGLFVGLKFAILIDQKNKVTAKTKGVSLKQTNLQQLQQANKFQEKIHQQIKTIVSTQYKALSKYQLDWKFNAKRWNRDNKQSSVLIQKYVRKINFIPKRFFDKHGKSRAYRWEQIEQKIS